MDGNIMKQTSWFLLIKKDNLEDGNARFLSFMDGYHEMYLPNDFEPKVKDGWVFYEFNNPIPEEIWDYVQVEAQKFVDIKWVEYYDAKDIEYDHIDVYFRRGDLGTRKDLQIVGFVDYREQIDEFLISNRMKEIYLVASIPKGWRQTVVDRIIESEDETTEDRWVLDKDKLSTDFKSILYTEDETTATKVRIDDVVITDELMLTEYVKKMNKFISVKDVNAWVGGSVTVGSGGTYATWAAVGSDAGTFTSAGLATAVSNTTEAQAIFTNAAATYDMEMDGGDYTFSFAGNNFGFIMQTSTSGDISFHNFRFKRTSSASSSAFACISISSTTTVKIYDSFYDGQNYTSSGFRISNSSSIMNVYNNIIYDLGPSSIGIQVDSNDGNTSSIYENNTLVDCVEGFDLNNNDGNLVNNVCVNNSAGDYNAVGSLSTFSKCASSDTTGSEASLRSLTASNIFDSLVDTDGDFLVPTGVESLHETGTTVTITGHNDYYNGVSITAGKEDIGAKGNPLRAWTGGNVTVGSGGTYTSWKQLTDFTGTFASNGTATALEASVQTVDITFVNDVGNYEMTLDGDGYGFDHSSTRFGFIIQPTSTGKVYVKNFSFTRSTGASSAYAAVIIGGASNSGTVYLIDNIFNAGGYSCSGYRINNSAPIVYMYNNILYNSGVSSKGVVVDSSDGNVSSIYENNVIFDFAEGFDMNSNTGTLKNNSCFDNSTRDYSDVGSLTAFDKCASSDTTGSEAGLRNLVAATVFQSLTDTDENFLWPVRDESLFGAGVNPTITGHITYYNGVDIVTDDVDVGANGLTPRILVVVVAIKKALSTKINIGSRIGSFY